MCKMYDRIVFSFILGLLFLENAVDGRKQKKTKQPTEVENHGPQPNVLTYSTFGFNDVGSYNGFVPTSPDYGNSLNKYKETPEKLYAPAFPSAPDSDFTSNSQSLNGEPLATGGGGQQISMLQYIPANSYGSSNFNTDKNINKNSAFEVDYRQNSLDHSSPVYGSKIISMNKNSPPNGYNNTELNNASSYQNNQEFSTLHESHSFNENIPSYSESNNNDQNFNHYATTYPTTEIENSLKAAQINHQNLIKYPKNVEFTKTKPYNTFETENKYSVGTSKPLDTFNSMVNSVSDETLNYNGDHNKLIRISPGFKNTFEHKDTEDVMPTKQNLNAYQDFSTKYSDVKYNLKNKKLNYDYKEEAKMKPWILEHTSYDKKRVESAMKGYEYATNFSNSNFNFDVNEPKNQFNTNVDEIIPLSSNIIDYSNYPFSDTGKTNLRNIPDIKSVYNGDNNEELSYNVGNKYNPSVDYFNKFKNLYSTVPTSSTNWGNIFKSSDYSSYKTHFPKSQYNDEENYEMMVQIPKRPNVYRYGKDSESTANDWSIYNKKPGKLQRPNNEMTKENLNNRFKSEEDLLGLRNHDTSHPSYLPTFQYNGSDDPEESFNTEVEKWRENYIKSKYRDTPTYDYEASEVKHVHASNPYQIEVPHPVLVPVLQPYPVRVPVAKPVAVPIVQEITVPIEKPVLYPVYKKVPYPIEKLVPVPVVKQVPVPVVKPYPVPVPQVRPVFHHSRPYRDEYDLDQDIDAADDYFPRPESSKVVYSKRPKSTRNRSRRPSRMSQQERNKGKRQQRRPNGSRERDQLRITTPPSIDYQRFRYHDSDFEDEREYSDYFFYCKRTGKC